jgi:hypothetical protein
MVHLIDVALGTRDDMLLELVATTEAHGSKASVWRARQTSDGNDWILDWQPLGKPGRGDPRSLSVIQRPVNARLEAFVIDTEDSAVWHSWQTDPEGGQTDPEEGWSEWDLLGNPGGHRADGAVALAADIFTIRVMALATAGGTLWHVSPRHPESSAFWPAWSPLGRPGGVAALAAAAATLANDLLEVVALGEVHGGHESPKGIPGDLWHRWQTTAGGHIWSDWEPLGKPGGKPAGPPTLVENANRQLELFTIADGRIWHRALRDATDPRSWTPWAPLSPPGPEHVVGAFGVARDASQRLVLVAAEGYHLRYTAHTTPGASTWTPWSSLATVPGPTPPTPFPLRAPVLGKNLAGLMELFVVIAATGRLYHLTETAQGQWPSTGRFWPPPP